MYNAHMNLLACWTIKTTEKGISVSYKNFVKNIDFDCGVCASSTPDELLWEFVLSEGDPGDFVVWNDSPPFQVLARVAV
jgi:hypothetical protein